MANKLYLGPKAGAAAKALVGMAESHNRLATAMESIAASLEKISTPPVTISTIPPDTSWVSTTPWSNPEHDVQADLDEAATKLKSVD